jgi:hypothetical protein
MARQDQRDGYCQLFGAREFDATASAALATIASPE